MSHKLPNSIWELVGELNEKYNIISCEIDNDTLDQFLYSISFVSLATMDEYKLGIITKALKN